MKVILISRRHGGSRTLEFGRWSRALLSLCCLGLPLGMLATGFIAGQAGSARALGESSLEEMQDDLSDQEAELTALRAEAENKLAALTLNLAELQARMTRLDALGEHLTSMASLEKGEFDFSQPPAMGGPMVGDFEADFSGWDLERELGRFEVRLTDRERQLEVLESLLYNRQMDDQAWLSGRPIEKGWISSYFGQRTDPFTGQPAMHYGIDFAGVEGSNVIAVAGGVVTWAGERSGYGEMVEVSHGDGLVTRYAHNKQNLVQSGDVVRKGEPIALMGSSGRSTGAHVHFELYKNGRKVDPSSYIRRTRR